MLFSLHQSPPPSPVSNLAPALSWFFIKGSQLNNEPEASCWELGEIYLMSWSGQWESHWQAQIGRAQLVTIWFYRGLFLLSFFEGDSTYMYENPWSPTSTILLSKTQWTENVLIFPNVIERCSKCIIGVRSELLVPLRCLIIEISSSPLGELIL